MGATVNRSSFVWPVVVAGMVLALGSLVCAGGCTRSPKATYVPRIVARSPSFEGLTPFAADPALSARETRVSVDESAAGAARALAAVPSDGEHGFLVSGSRILGAVPVLRADRADSLEMTNTGDYIVMTASATGSSGAFGLARVRGKANWFYVPVSQSIAPLLVNLRRRGETPLGLLSVYYRPDADPSGGWMNLDWIVVGQEGANVAVLAEVPPMATVLAGNRKLILGRTYPIGTATGRLSFRTP